MIEMDSLKELLKSQADFAKRAEKELVAARKNGVQVLRKLTAETVADALQDAKAALAAAEGERDAGIKALDARVAQCKQEVDSLQSGLAAAKKAGTEVSEVGKK